MYLSMLLKILISTLGVLKEALNLNEKLETVFKYTPPRKTVRLRKGAESHRAALPRRLDHKEAEKKADRL